MSMCDFPWLLSNVLDKKTAKPLGGAERYVILPKERTGSSAKIGILGIIADHWLAADYTNFKPAKSLWILVKIEHIFNRKT